MTTPTTPFVVPETVHLSRDFHAEFQKRCTFINPVNHGEFEGCVATLVEQTALDDSSTMRARPVIIQSAPRGGKTFMLHAVADILTRPNILPKETKVIFISTSSCSRTGLATRDQENAVETILSRIAWELTNRKVGSFIPFRYKYQNFGAAVEDWLFTNKVILIIDSLHNIHYTTPKYEEMCELLDKIVQRKGCALLYSTCFRGTADLLRGCRPDSAMDLASLVEETDAKLLEKSKIYSIWSEHVKAISRQSQHLWKPVPRIINEDCLRGIYKVGDNREEPEEVSFWAAVLRGRIPALALQSPCAIADYCNDVFLNIDNREERINCLKAVISGDIDSFQPADARSQFRAFSYMSERFTRVSTGAARYAWPPFLVARLAEGYHSNCWASLPEAHPGITIGHMLYPSMQQSNLDKAKAFGALTQLAILVRTLTQMEHDLVPMNSNAIQQAGTTSTPFATAFFYVHECATNISAIVEEVSRRFYHAKQIQQVVAVPLFSSFPVYDFFVLHRTDRRTWKVAAGYQCKRGDEYPSHDADDAVGLSVWLEGKCRTYRAGQDSGSRAASLKTQRGWIMVGESNQTDLLGVSILEALPLDPSCTENTPCSAEMHSKGLKAMVSSEQKESEPPSKKPRAI